MDLYWNLGKDFTLLIGTLNKIMWMFPHNWEIMLSKTASIMQIEQLIQCLYLKCLFPYQIT